MFVLWSWVLRVIFNFFTMYFVHRTYLHDLCYKLGHLVHSWCFVENIQRFFLSKLIMLLTSLGLFRSWLPPAPFPTPLQKARFDLNRCKKVRLVIAECYHACYLCHPSDCKLMLWWKCLQKTLFRVESMYWSYAIFDILWEHFLH